MNSGANQLAGKAQDYACRGWGIFPVHTDQEVSLHNVSTFEATADPTQIGRWWGQTPDANIALATGTRSGLWGLVVRGDTGRAGLDRWQPEFGPLPRTSTIRGPIGDLVYL